MTKASRSDRPKLQSIRPAVQLTQVSKAAQLTGYTGDDRSWRADTRGANERGYTYRWQKASKAFLQAHPLCQCEHCQDGMLRVTPATVVDHRSPHRGDPALFWDQSNWQAMATACHNRKTQAERRDLTPDDHRAPTIGAYRTPGGGCR